MAFNNIFVLRHMHIKKHTMCVYSLVNSKMGPMYPPYLMLLDFLSFANLVGRNGILVEQNLQFIES